MSNDLVERTTSIPDWMRKASTGSKLGNIDGSDLQPPRLKLLAGQSPEIMDGVPGAAVGQFWMTILNKNLGQTVTGSPIILKRSYQLWHPRIVGKTSEGPLATASDGIHWDIPDQTFRVIFPPNEGGGEETWKIGRRVAENRMGERGSSRPNDPKSKPAATLTYDILWVIDMPNGKKQLCVWTSTRTGITPTQTFISTCQARIEEGVDQFYQRYRIVSVKKTNKSTGDSYFTYQYWYEGEVESEEEGKRMRTIYDQYNSKSDFVTDIGDEAVNISMARNTERSPFVESPPQSLDDDIPF